MSYCVNHICNFSLYSELKIDPLFDLILAILMSCFDRSAVQCSAVQHSAVQNSTVNHRASIGEPPGPGEESLAGLRVHGLPNTTRSLQNKGEPESIKHQHNLYKPTTEAPLQQPPV